MKVVLLNDVPKVGKKYDVKEVSSGYASNMLIPKGLAKIATSSVLKQIEEQKKTDVVRKKVREDLLLKNIADIQKATITMYGKANEKGSLFAGIHTEELVLAIKEQTGLGLDADHLVLDEPLKEVGEHAVMAKVGETEAKFTVVIKAEE